MEKRIGVYICHCGVNISQTVDVESVVEFAKKLPNVTVAREYKFMCSDPGQEMIKSDIKELGINRVVVASCSPQMHEPTFRRAIQTAGLNPYFFEMANIREHCSWVTDDRAKASEKAKALVRAAVKRVFFHEPLMTREVPVNPNTLIVGGGIAGIQAALEIAESEHKVYLVEREPSIGGHMIQMDKTFPTLDCSACILTPKMTQVGSSPYIELLSYSEVIDVSGYVGNFKVKVRKKARYVSTKDCTGCGECAKVCPVEVPAEFEMGMSKRKATYRPFAQAVPGAFVIDKGGKSPCSVACPAGVNAHGYVALISKGKFKEALEVLRRTMPFAGVCGRVCTHPCESECERGRVDEPIAIRSLKRFMADYELKTGRQKASPVKVTREARVAVVGSGPAGLACAYDLVREGYRVTVFEASSRAGGMMRWAIPEYRLPKEILDNEIAYIQELGVEIKLNTPVKNLSELFNQGYKAIFLGTGASESVKLGVPGEDTPGVIQALDFLKQAASGSRVGLGDRVVVIGGGNAAVDAARVARRMGVKEVTVVYRRSRAEMPAYPEEVAEMENEGVKIQFLAAPVRINTKDGTLAGIKCIRMELGEADASGRRHPSPVKGSEFDLDCNNVIVAVGQSVNKAALPKELAFTGWGTVVVDQVTLETNIDGVFAGGDVVSGPSDVINSVAAGKEAAVSIDRYLRGADLRKDRPDHRERVKDVPKKGVELKARARMPLLPVKERAGSFAQVELGFDEKTAIEEASRCLNCAVCSECLECVKVCERKAIDHNMKEEIVELDVGNIILATGYQLFDPTPMVQYGYGRLDNVLTSLEFERMVNATGPTGGRILLKNGNEPKRVGLIHCVGSRDANYHEYCSRLCCMHSLKFAHLIEERLPGVECFEFYIDMRSAGKGFEEFYNRVLKEGTIFFRGRPGEITDVAERPEEEGKLIIQFEDTLVGRQRRLPVDMVVLSCALEPHKDADAVARMFGISCGPANWFLEKHPKLDPVATMTDGVFVIGCCQGPKDIPDTVAQASAAAARVLALISKGKVAVETAIASIDEDKCSGCRVCNLMCPYNAISYIEDKKVSRVNEVLCKGCGTCVATCPSCAITQKHFTTQQIEAEIEGVLV